MFRLTLAVFVLVFGACQNGYCQRAVRDIKASEEECLSRIDPFIVTAFKADPNDTALRKLQKERCRERGIALGKIVLLIEAGIWDQYGYTANFSEALKTTTSLHDNLLELMDKPADKIKCHELQIEFLKKLEHFLTKSAFAKNEPAHHINLARAARLDAEIELLKLKSTMK